MFIMIIMHFFSVRGLKGYFEEHDDEKDIILGPKKTKYLTITFTSKYQKFMYKEILKKIIKILIEIILRLNLNQTTMYF